MREHSGNKNTRWGALHVWSPREIIEAGLDYQDAVRFSRQYTDGVHVRRPDEMPTGTHRVELCTFTEAREAWAQRKLPLSDVDCLISRVQGTWINTHNMPTRDGWGERWATLIPEPTNESDLFAVSVEVDDKRIGYLKATIAYQFQWLVRALMSDGKICVVPCFIEHFDSAWVAIPTSQTWELRVNLDKYYLAIRKLWDSIPNDVAVAEVRKWVEHPSEEAAEELWKLRAQAPHFFPSEPGANNFSRVWHQVYQEVRRDYWTEVHRREKIERAQFNKEIVDLYATGKSMAAVGRELHISPERVRAGLTESDIQIRKNPNLDTPSVLERDRKVVELYQSGLSQYRIAIELGIRDSTVRKILVRRGVEIRKHTPSHHSTGQRTWRTLSVEEREARNREIIDRYNNGQSQGSLAREYSLDRKTIRTILRKANVTFRTSPTRSKME